MPGGRAHTCWCVSPSIVRIYVGHMPLTRSTIRSRRAFPRIGGHRLRAALSGARVAPFITYYLLVIDTNGAVERHVYVAGGDEDE